MAGYRERPLRGLEIWRRRRARVVLGGRLRMSGQGKGGDGLVIGNAPPSLFVPAIRSCACVPWSRDKGGVIGNREPTLYYGARPIAGLPEGFSGAGGAVPPECDH